MKNLIFILLLLPVFAKAQTFAGNANLHWDSTLNFGVNGSGKWTTASDTAREQDVHARFHHAADSIHAYHRQIDQYQPLARMWRQKAIEEKDTAKKAADIRNEQYFLDLFQEHQRKEEDEKHEWQEREIRRQQDSTIRRRRRP